MASTRPHPTATTRASTRRCSRCSAPITAAATTGRSPTSARACWRGWPAARGARCRGGASSAPDMPELPEVETIRRQLAPVVDGRELTALDVLDPRWCLPLAPGALREAVEGRRVACLARRGKYLVWELEDDAFLLMHLRMTGTLLYDPPPGTPYERVRWVWEGRRPPPRRPPAPPPRAPGGPCVGGAAAETPGARRLLRHAPGAR